MANPKWSLTEASHSHIFFVPTVLNSKLRVPTFSEGGFVSIATVNVIKPDGLVITALAQLCSWVEGEGTAKTKHSAGHISRIHVKEIVTDGPPFSVMLYFEASSGGFRVCAIDKTQLELLT